MRCGWILCASLLICSCAAPPPRVTISPTARPTDFPAATYQRAAQQGQPVYQIDPNASQLTVLVGRTGTLARLGHDHVLASHQIGGAVLSAADPDQARADLYVALTSFEVDPPALRAQSGLPGQLTAEEIAQTREHMLKDVLDAEHNPWVTVHATWAADAPKDSVLLAQVTLHGVTRPVRIPVSLSQDGPRLKVSGEFGIRQSDFGLTPYSLFGCALAVEDAVRLSFNLEATRITPMRKTAPGG